ncbi:MAG: hypothetical protein RIS47_1641 [Bacteroidota bacterium]|jgi:hypothetical protein
MEPTLSSRTLIGKAIVVLFRFTNEFAQNLAFVPAEDTNLMRGGWGSLILFKSDLETATPKHDLYFIPGKIDSPEGLKFYISKSYTDSQTSANLANDEFGIRQELATFRWTTEGKRDTISITQDNQQIFHIVTKRWSLPVSAPKSLQTLELSQKQGNTYFIFKPEAVGKGRMTHIIDTEIDPAYLPNMFDYNFVTCFTYNNLELTIPAASINSSVPPRK